MPRQVAVKLDLEAQKYITSAQAVKKTTQEVDDTVKALGRQTDATSHDMDELAVQAAAAKSEVDDLGDEARKTSAELKLLDGSLSDVGDSTEDTSFKLGELTKSSKTSQESIHNMAKKAEELAAALKALDARILATKAKVQELGIAFANTGDVKVGKDLGSQRSLLGRLTKVRSELVGVAADGLKAGTAAGSAFSKGFDSAISAIGPGKGILFGGLIAGAVAAAPMLASIIGGAVGGGVGTVAIAAGLLSASKDITVQAAAKEFGAHVSESFFGDSHAFVKPAIESIGILSKAFDGLHLGDSLAKAAPTVTTIVQGLADLATNVMPGLNKTIARLGPFADVAAQGFGDLGSTLGTFLDDVTSSKGAVEGLEAAFRLINGTVAITGKVIHLLEETYDAFLRTESSAYDNLRKLAEATGNTGIAALADHTHRLYEELINSDTAAGTVNATFAVMGTSASAAAKGTEEAATSFDDLNRSMDEYLNRNLSVDQATVAMQQDVLDLSQAVKEHGTSTSINTQTGLDNRKMIQGWIGDADRLRDATYKQTGSVVAADAAYKNQIDTLRALLEKLHFTKAQIDDLTGVYQITIHTNFSYSGYSSKMAALAKAADRFGGLASGGPVRAGKTYLVGEEGPEIFTAEMNGQIIPNGSGWKSASGGSDWQTAAPAGGGGGGGNRTITIIVKDTSGRTLRNELIDDAVARNQPGSVISAAYP